MSGVTAMSFLAGYSAWALPILLVLGPPVASYIAAVGIIPIISGAFFWLLSVTSATFALILFAVYHLDIVTREQKWQQAHPPPCLPLRPHDRVGKAQHEEHTDTPRSLAGARDKLLQLAVRDFVVRWRPTILGYQPGADEAFEDEAYTLLDRVLSTLSSKIGLLDTPSIYRKSVLEFTAHLEAIRLQETKLRGYADSDNYESDLFLASRYNQFRRLHPAVNSLASDTRPTELAHLRRLSARIVENLLPKSERQTAALQIIFTEILACTILLPLVDRISEPDFWCELVERKATMLLEEERLISNLRAAVDLEQRKAASSASRHSFHSKQSTSAAFDRYLSQIRRIDSLVEARKLRNNLKLRSDGTTESTKKMQMLQQAINVLDERILHLSSTDDRIQRSSSSIVVEDVTFSQVLNDPIATSYFSEFLDRRGRGPIIQYHISVDSWKIPLELPGIATASSLSKEDAARFASYLQPSLFSFLSKRYQQTLQSFHQGNPHVSESEARQAILESQQAVLEELLEEDWPAFRTSNQYRLAAAIIAEQQQKTPDENGHMTPFQNVVAHPRPPTFKRMSRTGSASSSLNPHSSSTEAGQLRRVEHSDLFGFDKDEGDADSGQKEELLASNGRDWSGEKHLQQLLGGKSGMLSHLEGRSPLFSDPLFDEDPADVQGVPLSSEGTRPSVRDEQYVRSETIDALQQTISDLVHTPVQPPPGSLNPSSDFSRAAQELRAVQEAHESVDTSLRPPRPNSVPRRSSSPQFTASRVTSGSTDGHNADDGDGRIVNVDLEGEEVERLQKRRQVLTSQLEVLSKLATQFELMGEALKEQQLIEKSIDSVKRELDAIESHLKELERYALEAARTSITIPTTTVNKDGDGKNYHVFHIRVLLQPKGGEGQAATWECYRRYSEFDTLHSSLLAINLPQMVTIDALFPGKRLVSFTSTPAFVEGRRAGLEKYLQKVVASPEACSTSILRRFLRQGPFVTSGPLGGIAGTSLSSSKLSFPGHSMVRDLVRNVDDLFFGSVPLVDVVSDHLSGSRAVGREAEGDGTPTATATATSLNRAIPGLSVTQAQAKEAASAGKPGTGAITVPLVDLLVELLDLKQDEWRRTAIVVVVQQVLGGTIDRQIRQRLRYLTSEDCLADVLTSLQDNLWPGGIFREGRGGAKVPVRSAAAREALRQRAKRSMDVLLPQMASLIGGEKAKKGARRLLDTLTQNRRLNRHLIYTFLDVLVDELFPLEKEGAGLAMPEHDKQRI